jgi:TolB-like protein
MFERLHVDVSRCLTLFAAVGSIALVLAPPLHAQPATFQKAVEAYEAHEYEAATDLFSEAARDSSVEKETRREALRHLGQIYIGRDERKKAREAIEQLIRLEPPPVKLDPNRHPPPLMRVYYEVRKENRGGYEVRQDGPGLQTLAIMDFRNSSVDQRERFASLSNGFPSMMINYLSGATGLKVIERERIQWVLDEPKLQHKTDVVDQSTAVRTGELLGATAVLFGNYIVHEDRMRLSARLMKVEKGEVLFGKMWTGKPDEFFKLAEKISRDVAETMNVEMEDVGIEKSGGTSLLDAHLAYAGGIDELESGNYRVARKHFQRALKLDPGYARAKKRLESIETMLASTAQDTTDGAEEGEDLRDTPNP